MRAASHTTAALIVRSLESLELAIGSPEAGGRDVRGEVRHGGVPNRAGIHFDHGEPFFGLASGFGGAAPTLIFSPSADPTPGKPRLHIDVNATDSDQDAELQRLLDLGAVPADVGQSGDEGWHVLADPEGNPFCLLRRRLAPL